MPSHFSQMRDLNGVEYIGFCSTHDMQTEKV